MAISRAKKQEIVAQTKQLFETSKLTVMVNYQGISVAKLQLLRSEMAKNDVSIKVVKNRLVKRALMDLKIASPKEVDLTGMLIYIFSHQDEVKGSQIVKKFIEKHQVPLTFVGGLIQTGEWLNQAQVTKLAKLGSKFQLIAITLNCLQNPYHKIQNNLNGLSNLLMTLKVNKI